MASNNLFFNLVLLLSLLLILSKVESRNLGGAVETGNDQDSTLVCNSIHGQESGETCSSIAQDFGLSLDEFLSFNPNIDCDSIFVGQWLCVDASASN